MSDKPTVHIITDAPTPRAVTDYPLAKWPEHIKEFNVVQSAILDIYDKNANAVIASTTGSGKTMMSELFMAHEMRINHGKTMYLAPLKALSKEKIDDWGDAKHHFSNLNLSICTGDYRLTPQRKGELANSNIILMTNEMLCSRTRNFKSEQNDWLKEVGVLVIDEAHIMAVQERGPHAEMGLIQFTELNPKCRLVLLSATMPNVKEIAEWVSKLTNRDTYLINSKFRPCELTTHWETYDDSNWSYEIKEDEKINSAINIVEDYPDDRFLLFVHTKATGRKLLSTLKSLRIPAEFHSADLEKSERHELETKFRTGNLRCLIATSSIAWGCNLPARRVIILGVHRGISEVESFDIWQMVGRSGRPGYDPRGDAYILLPNSKKHEYMTLLKNPQPIKSRLLDYIGSDEKPRYKTLAFHLVSEIHNEGVKTRDDVYFWFRRSLAAFQSQDLTDEIINQTLDLLKKSGAIVETDGVLKTTNIGRVASMYYYSPFDVSDLNRNFTRLFDLDWEENDIALSMALGAVDTQKVGFVSKAEANEMSVYQTKVEKLFGADKPNAPAIKGGFAYFCLLQGLEVEAFKALTNTLQFDYERTSCVLKMLNSLSKNWKKDEEFFDDLEARVTYGVQNELVPLCRINGVGAKYAEKFWALGLRTIEDVANNPDKVMAVIKKKKVAENIVDNAKKLWILT